MPLGNTAYGCLVNFRLDAGSENYESNQRAIRGAMGELDKVIWKAMETAGMLGSCRTTVTPDGISAGEMNPIGRRPKENRGGAAGKVGEFPGGEEQVRVGQRSLS